MSNATSERMNLEALKSWVMVVLTIAFVLLYGAALAGRLKPLSDTSVVSRLEPIIFVIIGYYFGRLPAQQNEKTLKDEATRQTQKADAAQHAKEQAMQSREALEERLKSVSNVLTSESGGATVTPYSESQMNASVNDPLRNSVRAALRILNS